MSVRILIVDDHQMVREGLRLLLQSCPDTTVIATCGDAATAYQLAVDLRPDLALVDIDLPDGSGIALTRRLGEFSSAIRVIVLTAHVERSFAVQAYQSGARGFLLKTHTSDELNRAIQVVMAGGIYLAPETTLADAQDGKAAVVRNAAGTPKLPVREAQVLTLVVQGLRNKEIAAELKLSVKTVETYRMRLMKRFGCESPAELVRHAIRAGLCSA